VPPDSVRQGVLNSQLGLYVYPGLQPYLNLPPSPNGTDQYGNPAFFASFSNPTATNATSVRIDEKIGEKVTLFGRVDIPQLRLHRSILRSSLTMPMPISRRISHGWPNHKQ